MAIKLDQIKSFLDAREIKYFDAPKHNASVHLVYGDDDFTGYVKIELEEDGELIQFYCNEIIEDEPLKVKDHKYQLVVLQYLLDKNYKEKFGTWELDPKDGEVRFAVEIPLEDNTLTEKQFDRILRRTLGTQENFEEIHQILKTGELPEDDLEKLALMAKLIEMQRKLEALEGKGDDDGI